MAKEYTRKVSVFDNVPGVGKILYFNDFRSRGEFKLTGTGSYLAYRDISKYFTPPASLKLNTNALTPVVGDFAQIEGGFRITPEEILYAYIVWRFFSENVSGNWDFEFIIQDGAEQKLAKLRYNLSGGKWQYWNENAAYADIPGGACRLTMAYFLGVSFGIDYKNGKYLFIESSNFHLDISDLAMQTIESDEGRYGIWRVKETTEHPGALSQLYLDYILLTNEML